MNREEITRVVLSRISDLTKSKVNVDSTLEELKIDSLSLVELVFEAEEKFNVRIADEKLTQIKSVNDVIEAIFTAEKN